MFYSIRQYDGTLRLTFIRFNGNEILRKICWVLHKFSWRMERKIRKSWFSCQWMDESLKKLENAC